jgi:hypothetical protein
MSETSKTSTRTTSRDSRNVTSSQESESGATPLERLDGQMILPCGLEAAPASLSVQAGKGKDSQISVMYGLHGSGSYESAALTSSLANRLRQKLASRGSTLFRLTWKERRTPSGRSISALRAAVRRTSGSDFTSLPTPAANEFEQRDVEALTRRRQECKERTGNGNGFGLTLGNTVSLATVPTPMAGTPAQKGYNEAGSTDSSRKIVELATVATPRGEDSESAGAHRGIPDSLHSQTQLASVATPRSTESGHTTGNPERALHNRSRLEDQVHLAMVPTPNTVDAKGGSRHSAGQKQLCHIVKTSGSGEDQDGSILTQPDLSPRQEQPAAIGKTATGGTVETESTGQLNPAYSRWLQGLPPEWDDCAVTGMRSLRPSRKPSSKRT